MLNHAKSLQFYWKDKRKETIFLPFIHISWNNLLRTALNNYLRYWYGFTDTYPLNGIGLDMDLDNSFWIWKILNCLLNNINICFFTPHNIWPREVELSYIWTIPLNIVNYTKEWGNILDALLTYVTMAFNTQCWIIGTIIWMELSSCTNYQNMQLENLYELTQY